MTRERRTRGRPTRCRADSEREEAGGNTAANDAGREHARGVSAGLRKRRSAAGRTPTAYRRRPSCPQIHLVTPRGDSWIAEAQPSKGALFFLSALPYSTDVLRKLGKGSPDDRIEELTPDRWLELHGAESKPDDDDS